MKEFNRKIYNHNIGCKFLFGGVVFTITKRIEYDNINIDEVCTVYFATDKNGRKWTSKAIFKKFTKD